MVINEATAGETTVGAPAPIVDPEAIIDADRADAVEYLDTIAIRMRQRKLKVNVEHHAGAADRVIVDRATELGASLILMTTHGRGGLGRLVFGSVADAVLRHAACPVLLVRITE
jgi:nucleotide-binding universal stress UspA family protein